MLRVNTASFFALTPTQMEAGSCVSVARSQPRGFFSVPELRELAPSFELLLWWRRPGQRTDGDWATYEGRYLGELVPGWMGRLFDYCSERNLSEVTLCCWERAGDPHCHRRILYDLLPEKYRGERN